jgi:hypothetical protein
LIIGQICPDILILAHISGYLTSAQRFTLREHYIVCTVTCSRRWIRSASVRTEVKDVLTRAGLGVIVDQLTDAPIRDRFDLQGYLRHCGAK